MSQLDDDGIDLAAYEAMKSDNLGAAQAAFSELLRRDGDDAFAAMWLGMVAVRGGDLKLAEAAFAHAVENVDARMWVEDENEGFSLGAKRAGLELSLRRVRERRAAVEATVAHQAAVNATGEDTPSASSLLRAIPIRRVHYSSLGHQEFEAQHAGTGVPVIITGIDTLSHPQEDGVPQSWTFEYLRKTCGARTPRVLQYNSESATWAGMHMKREAPATLSAYLDALEHASSASESSDAAGDVGVVFDWGLRLEGGCKELLTSLAVPSYFSNTIVAGYGPGLFIQPNGTRCGLHFDTGSTHFWQHVSSGAKRWRVWRAEDWPRLFSTRPLADGTSEWQRAFFRDARCTGLFGTAAAEAAFCEDGFGALLADGFDDGALTELADGAPLTFYEATLRAGEMIFVPARSPHQVINIGDEPSVALSMNYVDFSNLQVCVRSRLHPHSLTPWTQLTIYVLPLAIGYARRLVSGGI